MGGGGKSRKQKVEQEVKLDPDIKRAAMQQLAMAQGIAALPFPEQKAGTIAAFTPMQELAMHNLNRGMERFGFEVAAPTKGLPPTTTTGGISSYTIDPAYQDMKSRLPEGYLEGIQQIKDTYANLSQDTADKTGANSQGKNNAGTSSGNDNKPQNALDALTGGTGVGRK